jgi:AraC family transcriptional regulator
MRLQDVDTNSSRLRAIPGAITFGSGYDGSEGRVSDEATWRCSADVDRRSTVEADILVSRWIDSRNSSRHEQYVSSSDRYIIGVSLKTTRLRLTRGPNTIFDGVMPAGTLHVIGPSQPLAADFRAASDFVHFHVRSEYFRRSQRAAQCDPFGGQRT